MAVMTDLKLVQPDRISATVSVTRNLGNYESLRVEARFDTAIQGDESPEAAYDRAWAVVEAEVTEKVQEALAD